MGDLDTCGCYDHRGKERATLDLWVPGYFHGQLADLFPFWGGAGRTDAKGNGEEESETREHRDVFALINVPACLVVDSHS